MVTFLRAVVGLALGLVVLAGLLYLLVAANFSQRLEDPEVYKAAVVESGAYDRIYDEVLVDDALRERTGRLLGDMEIATHEDAVRVLRDIMPPDYLQQQTEDNIDRFTGYLRYESEDLELYVSLTGPLERIEPAALGEVPRFIDELEVADPGPSGCSTASLRQLAAAAAEPYSRLSQGQLPESAPSLEILSRECREREFDRWFGLVVDDPVLNSPAARILQGEREELRRSFVEGDTRGFLKAAAEPAVQPLTEGAVAGLRRNLQPGDRFDLLEWLAGPRGSPARADLDVRAETLREALGAVNGPGRVIALAMAALGSLLLALVHLPRPAAMLRWPGIALLTCGGVCLIAGLVLNSALPDLVRGMVMGAAAFPAGVPVSAMDLAGDLLESFVRRATAGFVPGTLTVMALGGVLIAASLFCGRLSALARRTRHAPERSGRGGG